MVQTPFLVLFLIFISFQAHTQGVKAFEEKGRRQIPEGYILSPLITSKDLPSLKSNGVKTVISLVDTPDMKADSFKAYGIEQKKLLMGNEFTQKHIEALLQMGDQPGILIHCKNGADRTGAVAAFFLAVFKGWSIADAFGAVVYPNESNTSALNKILNEENIHDGTYVIKPGSGKTGIYATFGPRGGGGHKTTGTYGELTRSTIKAIIKARARLAEHGEYQPAAGQ